MSDPVPEPSPCPAWHPRRQAALREKLILLAEPFWGSPDDREVAGLARKWAPVLKADPMIVAESVRAHLADEGGKFLLPSTSLIAARLLENRGDLVAGRIILPWRGHPHPSWQVARLSAVWTACANFDQRDKQDLLVQWRVQTGLPAGQTGSVFWSRSRLHFCLRYATGLRSNDIAMRNPMLAVGILAQVIVRGTTQRDLDAGRIPPVRLDGFEVTDALKKHNRGLIKARRRANGPCHHGLEGPRGLPYDCDNIHGGAACPVGTDKCALALRQRTLVQLACGICGHEGLGDPDNGCCQKCFVRARSRTPWFMPVDLEEYMMKKGGDDGHPAG